jgi:hypothetical protein
MQQKKISNGGEMGDFPSHILPGIMAAYVQGADYIKLTIQSTKDNQMVAYGYNTLEESTDVKGKIQDHNWSDVIKFDPGYKFKKGDDLPWKKHREPYEFNPKREDPRALMPSLENILKQMPIDSKFILEICFDLSKLQVLNALLNNHDQKSFIILFRNESELLEGEKIFGKSSTVEKIGLIITSSDQKFTSNPDILYFRNSLPKNPSVDYVIESDSYDIIDEKAWGICYSSILKFNERSYSRIYFEEKFAGKSLNKEFWYSGISSGFEQHARYMWDAEKQRRLVDDSRTKFDTRLYVDDGLIIDIREGYQYASAGVLSRFPLKGDFAIEVDWTFANPQRATQMAVGFRNSDIFEAHDAPFNENGEIVKDEHSRWQNMWEIEHQSFDTHGGPSFVMIEHEEKDGNRLCSNRVQSGFFRWYNNFYFPNVGDGSANEGTFRLQRKGKYFAAYYKDKHNKEWVGISAVENESMNESLFLTLGAKHYPKREAPGILPANHVTYKNVKVIKPNKK